MPVTKNVNENVTRNVTKWEEALRDAEQGLENAQRIVASWKATIQTCRKRVAESARWPAERATRN